MCWRNKQIHLIQIHRTRKRGWNIMWSPTTCTLYCTNIFFLFTYFVWLEGIFYYMCYWESVRYTTWTCLHKNKKFIFLIRYFGLVLLEKMFTDLCLLFLNKMNIIFIYFINTIFFLEERKHAKKKIQVRIKRRSKKNRSTIIFNVFLATFRGEEVFSLGIIFTFLRFIGFIW